ncbi:phage minor head protein [Chromatium okenii]|jgi:SPP1 gp7 family putative phage head morphogenesis protein|uniref:phage minor head protein n=1 Tax=Chromatium okenii TaxID=61644 RepID=UPI0026F00FD3|nr:phage minor head protein [Chromatium okenii]MBV5309300.1 minor capsid protein [Chromatium okenii]
MEESANTQLRDKTIAHEIYLQRYYSSTSKKVMDLLRETEKDLVRQLKTLDLDNQMTIPQIDARLESVRAILNEGYALAGKELISDMHDAAEYEQEWQIKAVNESTPIVLDMVAVAPVTLFAAVESKPLQGKLIKEWIDKLDQDSYTRIQDAVRMGLVEGQSYNDVVKRITGTKALQYTDGVMALNKRQTQALVSTAMAHATNTASTEYILANQDIFSGVQWVSTLDRKTSNLCKANDGKIISIEEVKKGALLPPAHIRCRSGKVSVLKSWKALGIKNPDGRTRASMDGQVAQTETYQTWLKKKPEAFQDEVLGKARADLYRAGMPLDRFVDDSGHTYTLDELKKKEN